MIEAFADGIFQSLVDLVSEIGAVILFCLVVFGIPIIIILVVMDK